MAINFKSFDELFAPAYQSKYIVNDCIQVDKYYYSVFSYYSMSERQVIFQICEKHLPWKYTESQEQWERTMYMYQFIIKSPSPFPYPEYEPILDSVDKIEILLKAVNTKEELNDAIVKLVNYCDYNCGQCAKDPPNNEAHRAFWPTLNHREALKRFYKELELAKARVKEVKS